MFETRLKNLQKSLKKHKVAAYLVSSSSNISYLTGLDSFSHTEREAYLFITPTSAILFTDPRYIEDPRIKVRKNIKPMLHTKLFKQIKGSKVKLVGFEHNLTFAEHERFQKDTSIDFVLEKPLVELLRVTKDEDEIKNIKAACRLTDKTFDTVRKLIKVGMTEAEVAWKIEKNIRENGGELAFDSIVAFGANSAIPHHKTSNKKLLDSDQFVLLDFGAKINGYHADMTRTILTKNAKPKTQKMYQAVLETQQKAIEYINTSGVSPDSPEVRASEVAKVANEYLKSQGFEDVPHGLGHGIGIEIHEHPHLSPRSNDKLMKGNVFTIEPGIYIPGFGGVRIEDDFLLSNKLEQLTKSPK